MKTYLFSSFETAGWGSGSGYPKLWRTDYFGACLLTGTPPTSYLYYEFDEFTMDYFNPSEPLASTGYKRVRAYSFNGGYDGSGDYPLTFDRSGDVLGLVRFNEIVFPPMTSLATAVRSCLIYSSEAYEAEDEANDAVSYPAMLIDFEQSVYPNNQSIIVKGDAAQVAAPEQYLRYVTNPAAVTP